MSTLEDYFLSTRLEERRQVKGIICDAYQNYLKLPEKFLPNACLILDSFHVVKYIISRLNPYLYRVLKRYQERARKRLKKKNYDTIQNFQTIQDSREGVLLKRLRMFRMHWRIS